jgi:hypothetical protein
MSDAEIDAAIAVHEAAIEVLRKLRWMSMPTALSAPVAVKRQSIAKCRWELAAKALRRDPKRLRVFPIAGGSFPT